jgi:acetyl esterase
MKRILIITLMLLIRQGMAVAQEIEQTTPTPEQYRAGIAQSIADLKVEGESVSAIINTRIPAGMDSIPIRIYYPDAKGALPVLINIHGGCWVAGDLDTHDNICRYLCNQTASIIVAIDYRRPPEDRFPVAVEDVYAALLWIYRNAELIGGDNCRIGVIGDSSGGNLAAALCLKNRAECSRVPIIAQVLINPVLDLRPNSASYKTYMGCVSAYLNDMTESFQMLASPLSAEHYSDLPKALIITSEKDESKNEAYLYHTRLLNEGVYSNIIEIKGIGHFGGLWAAGASDVDEAKTIVASQLNSLLK